MLNKGKWHHYSILQSNVIINTHLPKTVSLSEDDLLAMLEHFHTVILKPTFGRYGVGIIRISKLEDGRFEIHRERFKWIVDTFEELSVRIKKLILRKLGEYIVQQYIPLTTIDGKSFDVRVVVQRSKKNKGWFVTGHYVKIAEDGYFITNCSEKIYPLRPSLKRSSLPNESINHLILDLKKLSVLAANVLSAAYPRQRIYGIDIGIDQHGHVWIIEVNFKPIVSDFLKLPKRTAYLRIKKYL